MDDTVALLARWAHGDSPRRVATANLDFLRHAATDRSLRGALRSADLVTADGWPLVALSRVLGLPIRQRVPGSDLVPALAAELARTRRSIFLLGGAPGIAEAAARRLRDEHPGLGIAGTLAPFVDWDDSAQVAPIAAHVARSRADVVLVALGSPRQELFLERWLDRTQCRLGVGVGATLDFIAGRSRRAPRFVQAVGLEWAHRLAQEPSRLAGRYAKDAAFLARLVRAELSLGLGTTVHRPVVEGGAR